IHMMRNLMSKGVLVAVTSGRPLCDLIRLFSDVLSDIIIVSYDGSLAVYKNNIIISRPIQKDLLFSFIDTVKNGGVLEYAAYGAGCVYVNSDFSKNAVSSMEKAGTMEKRVVHISDFYKIDEPIFKMSVYIKPSEANMTHDYEYFISDWENYLKNIYTGNGWCEFIMSGTDKGSAVEVLCEKFSVNRDEVMAFGDGINDVSMLSFAGFSFAVNTEISEVRSAAKYETEDVLHTVNGFFGIEK
ncbi:MAG: HAD-IIB family hydrolase, partial [Clostridia bacterium]|nr:HAD-IIB family hydrolase [Clostridia bacterium]